MTTPWPTIAPLDAAAVAATLGRWDSRAKPPGALGRIEDLGVTLAGITGQCPPHIVAAPAVLVFAGDHGVVADGASAWPQEVTAAMVATMAAGGAAINAFAAVVGATVSVIDVGVAGDVSGLAITHRKVRPGTASLARGQAMPTADALSAVEVGLAAARDAVGGGADCLVGGEMGIGNTTPSAALIAAITGAPALAVTGRGAGLPTDRLSHKAQLVAGAVARVAGTTDPVELLAELGGLEIAALAGLFIGAAEARVPAICDGVIAVAALLVADALAPGTAARTIAGHRSAEPAAAIALDHLGLTPLLDLDLRLGEGTGACLAIPLLQAAATALHTMAPLPPAPLGGQLSNGAG